MYFCNILQPKVFADKVGQPVTAWSLRWCRQVLWQKVKSFSEFELHSSSSQKVSLQYLCSFTLQASSQVSTVYSGTNKSCSLSVPLPNQVIAGISLSPAFLHPFHVLVYSSMWVIQSADNYLGQRKIQWEIVNFNQIELLIHFTVSPP